MNFNLKNCPFCGNDAMLFAGMDGVKVCCSECGCSTPTFVDSEDKKHTTAVECAIFAWNMRRDNAEQPLYVPYE